MKGYGQFCPVAKAAEVVAERWTPLVLRELLCGSHHFAALRRGIPLMSRSLLVQRLRELEDAGVVQTVPKPGGRGREYRLTRAGEELRPIIMGLGVWGLRWSQGQVRPHDLDPSVLMWDVHRRINVQRLPSQRVVIRFDFRGVPRQHAARRCWWLVLDRASVDVCLKDPGHEIDLVVDADLTAYIKVWMGEITLAEGMRAGAVRVEGPRELVQRFPGWLRLSVFAGTRRVPDAVAG